MKKLVLMVCVFINYHLIMAQGATVVDSNKIIIGIGKTTILVFPCAITYVDRGTPDVLVKAIKESPGKLLVKAAKSNFSSTSISVITEDGRIYCFTVNFGSLPGLIYNVPLSYGILSEPSNGHISDVSPPKLKGLSDELLHRLERGRLRSNHGWDMEFDLKGLYINNDFFFLTVEISNYSFIPYDVDSFRILVKDEKGSRRIAVQERELQSIFPTGNLKTILANSTVRTIVLLPKFTLPKGKECLLELSEKNGARCLHLRMNNHLLLKARPI
ncbi:MAG: conjugative transposon protein TraN [Flavisolibacter sp.]